MPKSRKRKINKNPQSTAKPQAPVLAASAASSTLQLTDDALGSPGTRSFLHMIPQFHEPGPPDRQVFEDRELRNFVVTGLLSKTPSNMGRTRHIAGNFTVEDGDSYMLLPPKAVRIKVNVQEGELVLDKNSKGEVSQIALECVATDHFSAHATFIAAANAVIDHVCYEYNMAIFIPTIRVYDTKYQSTHMEYISPFRQQVLPDSNNRLFDEMRPVYAMYREAKCADSDFYKFMCCYKIMEGLFGKRRSSVWERAKAEGTTLRTEREIVPDDKDFSTELREYAGKPMKAFFDDVLTARFRNAVAHLDTDEGTLHVGSPMDLYTYSNLARITDACARALIASHENLLSQLKH